MVDNQQSDDYSTISRRRFAQIAGATGAAALAGCGGGDTTTEGGGQGATPTETATATETETSSGGTDTGNDTTTEEQTKVYDVTFQNLNDTANTGELHWNYINSGNYASWPAWTTTDRGMAFNFKKGTYVPYVFESWDIGTNKVTLNIRKDMQWADGTDYTSQHAKEELALSHIVGGSIWDYLDSLDSIKTPDDKTVVLQLSGKSNPTILKHALGTFQTNLRAKKGTPYADVYNAMKKNGVDNVPDKVKKKVSDWAPKKPPMTAAPFVHDKQDANGIRLKRNPKHPDAGNINFKYYSWGSSPGNQHKQAQLMSGKVDSVMSLFCPPRIVANMPDGIEESRPPAKWGYGLMPNHERPHVKKRKVRQAIQYALDRKTIIKNAGPRTKQTPQTPGGIAASEEKHWLGDQINNYKSYTDSAKGKQALKDAGYSKDGGTWKNSNGKAANLTVNVMAGWSDWVTAAQTIVSQLNEFGFAAELNSVPGGSVWGDILPNSKFQIQSFWWLPGGARSSFPYYPLRHQYGYVWNGTNPHNYPAWNGGDGKAIEIPAMDGGTKSIDPVSRVGEIASMTDSAKVKKAIRELHWVNNVDQPMMPIAEKLEQSWYRNSGDWDGPNGDSAAAGVKWPPCWLPKQGQLKYVGN